MLTNLMFCFWRISRILTERLRIFIHVSNYFQTLEILEKTLSDKNEPNTKQTNSSPIILRYYSRCPTRTLVALIVSTIWSPWPTLMLSPHYVRMQSNLNLLLPYTSHYSAAPHHSGGGPTLVRYRTKPVQGGVPLQCGFSRLATRRTKVGPPLYYPALSHNEISNRIISWHAISYRIISYHHHHRLRTIYSGGVEPGPSLLTRRYEVKARYHTKQNQILPCHITSYHILSHPISKY